MHDMLRTRIARSACSPSLCMGQMMQSCSRSSGSGYALHATFMGKLQKGARTMKDAAHLRCDSCQFLLQLLDCLVQRACLLLELQPGEIS